MSQFDYEKQIWGLKPLSRFYFEFHWFELVWFLKVAKEASLVNKQIKYLDVGCGGANFIEEVSRRFPDWRIFGLDLAFNSLKAARRYSRLPLVQGTVEKLPFRSGSLNLVSAMDVLEHLPDLPGAIAEIKRVLKPGGLVLAAIPLERQPWTIYWLMHRFGWQGKQRYCGHLQQLTDKEAIRTFRKAGLAFVSNRFGYHYFTSVVDVLYYLVRVYYGKQYCSFGTMVDEFSGWKKYALKTVRMITTAIGFLESRLLWWFPGGKGHFVFRKEKP